MEGEFFNIKKREEFSFGVGRDKKQSREDKIIFQIVNDIFVKDFEKSTSPDGDPPTSEEVEEYKKTLLKDIMGSSEVKKEILDTYLTVKIGQERDGFESSQKSSLS